MMIKNFTQNSLNDENFAKTIVTGDETLCKSQVKQRNPEKENLPHFIFYIS